MNKREEMLVITMEECGELIQACSKLLRFGENQDHTQIQEEIGDVMCMIEILCDQGIVTQEKIRERIEIKKEKLRKWSKLFVNEV